MSHVLAQVEKKTIFVVVFLSIGCLYVSKYFYFQVFLAIRAKINCLVLLVLIYDNLIHYVNENDIVPASAFRATKCPELLIVT